MHDIVSWLKTVAYIDQDNAKRLQRSLHESEQYLGTDFKVHLKEQSNVADHCLMYALSDPNDPDFQAKPGVFGNKLHSHNFLCPRCQFVNSTFEEIRNLIVSYRKIRECDKKKDKNKKLVELEEIDDKMADYEDAIEKITEMKRHYVRAARSQQARRDIFKNLKSGIAHITIDWAQKQDPLYFTETQRVNE